MSCAGQTKNEKHYAGHAIQFSITKQKFMERQFLLFASMGKTTPCSTFVPCLVFVW